MDRQFTFANSEFNTKGPRLHKSRMEPLPPCTRPEAIIEAQDPKPVNGHRSCPLPTMLQTCSRQQWHLLSTSAIQAVIYEMAFMRLSSSLSLDQAVSDHSISPKFHRLLDWHNPTPDIFQKANQQLTNTRPALNDFALTPTPIIAISVCIRSEIGEQDSRQEDLFASDIESCVSSAAVYTGVIRLCDLRRPCIQ